jgi:hypothetical protein
VGEPGPKIKQYFTLAQSRRSLPLLVVTCEFQFTWLALRSTVIKTGNPPPKDADQSDPTMGREGERYTANILRRQLANIICMAVASNLVKSRTGTE